MESSHLYLAHHGIKGMKWGVRRFQNKDGSLTSAGKKRYEHILNTAEKKRRRSDSYKQRLDAADSHAMTGGPQAYGRYITSGARRAQGQMSRKLNRSAKRAEKKAHEVLDSLGDDYQVVYDVTTKQYVIRERQ